MHVVFTWGAINLHWWWCYSFQTISVCVILKFYGVMLSIEDVGRTCRMGFEQLSWEICGEFEYSTIKHCFTFRWETLFTIITIVYIGNNIRNYVCWVFPGKLSYSLFFYTYKIVNVMWSKQVTVHFCLIRALFYGFFM